MEKDNLKGKNVLTQTDAAGRFSLRASSSDVLEVTHVSFATFEITVGDASNIPIFLKSKEGTLGEVVVTSLGIRKAKRELGYTVTEVKGEEVEQTQRDNFLMALAGRVPGANITATSGMPGSSVNITLRGITSLTSNNSPLFCFRLVLPVSLNELFCCQQEHHQ